MPNLKANQLVSSQLPLLTILWQNDPTSWQQDSDNLARQFLGLMGNDPSQPWNLVLDIDGPNSTAGSWNQATLLALLQSLASLGMQPNLIFHPDGEKATKDWISNSSTPPTQQDLENEWTAMVDYMALFNTEIAKANSNLPDTSINLPEFTSFLAEGNDFSPLDPNKSKLDTFNFLKVKLQAQGIKNPELWNTGDWQQGIALSENSDGSPNLETPDSGVYMQIYDFYNKSGQNSNTLVGKPTDPSQAVVLGSTMVSVLQDQNNLPMNPGALRYPNRSPQIFNFSGQNQAGGSLNDAPVFGGLNQPGVVEGQGWNITSFNQFLQNYKSKFQSLSNETAPTLGIWAAENALNVLAPQASSLTRHENAFSSIATENENDLLVNKYQQNLLIHSDVSGKLIFNLEICAALRSGIGIYPLLDDDARIVTPQGRILSINDSEYLTNAKQLAINTNNWFIDSRPAGDAKAHKFTWEVQLNPNQRYALIADSDLQTSGALYSSINYANFDKTIQFAPTVSNPKNIIGFEDLPNGDNDFNDIKLEIPNIENIFFKSSSLFMSSPIGSSNNIPEIDVLWQDASALDDGSAYQIAQLINGNPKNIDLKLIINISGPGSTANPTPVSHINSPVIKNSPQQLVDFINNIDLYVKKLGGSWNGPIVYHPDATVNDFGNDWSGFTGTTPSPIAGNPEIKYTLTADATKTYAAYIDYLNVLNIYLQNETTNKRYFNEFIFEYENSQFALKNGGGEAAIFSANSVVRSYQANPNLLIQGKTPLDNITLSGSSSPIDNWDSKNDRAGWGADLFYAQIYDLRNDTDYNPTWENSDLSQIDPKQYSPSNAADLFANFFTNSTIVTNPRDQIYNINRMVLPQADSQIPATRFDPRANFIFSYGPYAEDGPVFYSINPEKQWTWNADEFASFLTGLRTNLPPTLDKIAHGNGFVSGVEDFKLGVWGADRALDAWFGVPSPLELGRLRNEII